MATIPLLPLFYLPPVSWCAAAWNGEDMLIECWENYQKGSLRNRCYIAGPNGIQGLSIPLVKGKHQQTPLQEVRISYDEPWQRQHWRSICTAYGNAPYFEHYAAELAPFYERRYEFLFNYNLDLLEFILCDKLNWKGMFECTQDWLPTQAYPLATDLREAFSGEPGVWPEWFIPVRYPQVFEERHGFLPNLSVLDVLFCCGKRGGEILNAANPGYPDHLPK
ncbi:MAG: hypothetical protein EPGJADBJ_01996 [Saprospiraceae bacterium]|nr:hypothetical protein [Saprospiraceae bacterium]